MENKHAGRVVTKVNKKTEYGQSTNFGRVHKGAWFKSSCAKNLKCQKLTNLGFVQVFNYILVQVSDVKLREKFGLSW